MMYDDPVDGFHVLMDNINATDNLDVIVEKFSDGM